MADTELTESQLASEVGPDATKSYLLSKQATLMAKAIHIFHHPDKSDQATCLGTVVAHNKNCKNSIKKSTVSAVLIEMVDAAENPSPSNENFKKRATEWGRELLCHLHKDQEGAKKAVLNAIMLYRKTAPCGSKENSGTAKTKQLKEHLRTTENISQTSVDKVSARIAQLESKFDAFEDRLAEKHNAFFEMMRNDLRKEFKEQLRELKESFTQEDTILEECLTERMRELEMQFELRLDAIMRGFADVVENCQARSQKREQFILSKCEEKKSNLQTQVNHVAKVLKVFYAED